MFHAYKFRLEPDINQKTCELEFVLESCHRLDKAFQVFFCRVMAGYPRCKDRDRHDRFTDPGIGDGARMIGKKVRRQRGLCPGSNSESEMLCLS